MWTVEDLSCVGVNSRVGLPVVFGMEHLLTDFTRVLLSVFGSDVSTEVQELLKLGLALVTSMLFLMFLLDVVFEFVWVLESLVTKVTLVRVSFSLVLGCDVSLQEVVLVKSQAAGRTTVSHRVNVASFHMFLETVLASKLFWAFAATEKEFGTVDQARLVCPSLHGIL